MTKRLLAIGVAMVMVMGLIELATPGDTSAVPVSKSLTGTCTGADPDTNALLGALGGTNLAVDFTINADVPKTLDPGQSGVPISFTWSVSLGSDLINKAVGAGLTQLTIRNAVFDTVVAGPTSTTQVLGRPADQSITLAANMPSSIPQGPFTGTLNDVGQSGVITYKTGTIGFTITAQLGGERNLNITCSAPGLIASSPIKVPGSPDITQPIEYGANAGQVFAVNVIGEYVTRGKTDIVPSSLRVVDGPGVIENGNLVVTAGGAPSSNSVTFEVCGLPVKVADAVPGTNEVQHLSLDKGTDLLKKSIGFTLKLGGQETAPIWTATPNLLGRGIFGNGPLAFGMPTTKVANWAEQAGNYALWTDPALPPAATLQAALEALPTVGAGNVAVTQTAPGEYDLAFQGALAGKDVASLSVGDFYSNLPLETLDSIIAAASSLSSGSSGPTTTTTIPAGLSANDYIVQLILQGRTDEAGRVLSGQLLGGIDVTATIAGLTAAFPKKPNPTTPTAGVDPVAEQFQDLCSQGSLTATVAAPPAPPAAVLPAFSFQPAPAAKAPAVRTRCSTKTVKVRVRIKGTKRYRLVRKRVTVCPRPKATTCTTKTKRVKVRIKGTNRYRTVNKKVRVCSSAKATSKKTSSKKSSSKQSTSRRTSTRRR